MIGIGKFAVPPLASGKSALPLGSAEPGIQGPLPAVLHLEQRSPDSRPTFLAVFVDQKLLATPEAESIDRGNSTSRDDEGDPQKASGIVGRPAPKGDAHSVGKKSVSNGRTANAGQLRTHSSMPAGMEFRQPMDLPMPRSDQDLGWVLPHGLDSGRMLGPKANSLGEPGTHNSIAPLPRSNPSATTTQEISGPSIVAVAQAQIQAARSSSSTQPTVLPMVPLPGRAIPPMTRVDSGAIASEGHSLCLSPAKEQSVENREDIPAPKTEPAREVVPQFSLPSTSAPLEPHRSTGPEPPLQKTRKASQSESSGSIDRTPATHGSDATGAQRSSASASVSRSGEKELVQPPPDSRFQHATAAGQSPHHAEDVAATLPHDALRPILEPANAQGAKPASGAIEKAPREAFAALDTETAIRPAWSQTGMNKAEAGFEDPALGWVRVRAQLDPSGIHATIVPLTTNASQTLSEHLNGLGSYLSDHHTRLETWTVVAPENPGETHSLQQGGQGLSQGDRQNRGASEREAPVPREASSPRLSTAAGQSISTASGHEAGRGRYVSLVA